MKEGRSPDAIHPDARIEQELPVIVWIISGEYCGAERSRS